MTTLLRKILKNNSKHKKLSEEWVLAECESEGWWRDSKSKSRDDKGEVRYAGTVAVERSASAPATAMAVRSALHTAKSSNKKLQRVSLDISPKGIVVTDADSQINVLSLSIYTISYCSADAANARVFAVVEGRHGNGGSTTDSHVAHVFVCSRRKQARSLALSLAHAFNDAFQAWQSNQAGTTKSEGKSDPWVQFDEESDDEDVEADSWNTVAPLVTFA